MIAMIKAILSKHFYNFVSLSIDYGEFIFHKLTYK